MFDLQTHLIYAKIEVLQILSKPEVERGTDEAETMIKQQTARLQRLTRRVFSKPMGVASLQLQGFLSKH